MAMANLSYRLRIGRNAQACGPAYGKARSIWSRAHGRSRTGTPVGPREFQPSSEARAIHRRGCNAGGIFDATANLRSYRDRASQAIPHFIEVYVDSPLEVCMKRDPKGIYRQAREGKFPHVPGVGVAYEPPESPDVVIHGDREDADDAARRIVRILVSKGFVAQP
jgi:hypothetical protein